MSRTILIDPLNKGFSHVYINAAITQSIKGSKLFIGNKSHIAGISQFITCKFIATKDTYLFVGIVKKIFFLVKYCIWRKQNLFFLCTDNTVVPILLILCYPLLFRVRLTIVIHNNLTTLTHNSQKRRLHNWVMLLYDARILVLTGEMERIYKKEIRNTNRCVWLVHPNYKELVKTEKDKKMVEPSKINIILLGRQAGFMIDFLERFDLEQVPKVNFTIVYSGSIDWVEKKENITHVKKKLSFNNYYNLLNDADFCLFAPDESVKNRASGILMDCVTMECPIIAPDFGHFLEYKKFDIGYLYKDIEELEEIIKTINKNYVKRESLHSNFKGALMYSSIRKISRDLIAAGL